MKYACGIRLMLLVGMVSASTLHAQREQPYEFADIDGVWVHIQDFNQALPLIKLTATQQSIAVQKREAIFEILKNSKALVPMKGLALRAEKRFVSRMAGADGKPTTASPVEMLVGMTIGKYTRSAQTKLAIPFTIEMPRIDITTNSPQTVAGTWSANKFWYEGLHDDQHREFYLEPNVTGTSDAGLNIYRLDAWHEEVVVTNGKPLWIFATSEQFLRAMITYARELREKENENSRSSGAPLIPEERSAPLQFVKQYEKELAALSPAERQQPGYYLQNNDNPLFSGLVKAGTPWSRRVVMDNPDYLNGSLPRTAIQLIACVYNYNRPYGSDEPEKTDLPLRTLNNLVRHFEYEKLASLIDK